MKALNQAMQCNMVVVCHNLLHNISMSSISHRIPLPTTFNSYQKYKKMIDSSSFNFNWVGFHSFSTSTFPIRSELDWILFGKLKKWLECRESRLNSIRWKGLKNLWSRLLIFAINQNFAIIKNVPLLSPSLGLVSPLQMFNHFYSL